MPTIKGKAIKKWFPYNPKDERDFCVCSYSVVDGDLPDGISIGDEFRASGCLLPYAADCMVILRGDWKTGKDGMQFEAKHSVYDTPQTYIEVRNVLACMPYLGEKIANRIINELGASALQTLDAHPELLEQFVSKGEAKRAMDAYMLRRPCKDAFLYLVQHKVSCEQAESIALAVPSLTDLKADPFGYSVGTRLSFRAATKIAKEEGIPSNTLSGAMASLVDIIQQAEGSSDGGAMNEDEPAGNTYVELDVLMKKAAGQVGLLQQDELLEKAFNQLLTEGIIQIAQDRYVYRTVTANAEYGIAKELHRLCSVVVEQADYHNDIAAFEVAQKMRLAPEQRNAVKTALNNAVTLLIGGPGTGKTTIERVIIQLYRKFHPGETVLLLAPTGKAACRMSESTGEPAFTIHKGLDVVAGEEVLQSNVVLDAGLILIDEASMLGSQESWALFKAIKTGTQIVIVGDTNQLPSVGAGNVLSELIRSKCFALAQLVTVYRQKADSAIATNCARIKLGKTELEYTDTFTMSCVNSQKEALDTIMQTIRSEMAQGLTLDDICVLSPYRKSTLTGTNQINKAIQAEFSDRSQSISYGKRIFYIHDKVMFKANRDAAVNGDVGKIVKINGNKFAVNYGDGRILWYDKFDLWDFDLAFAITIHKSQGAEFHSCIIVCMPEHEKMLRRNLIYTAVSRAKSKAIIVGKMVALKKSITTEDASIRNSRLAALLQYMTQNHDCLAV